MAIATLPLLLLLASGPVAAAPPPEVDDNPMAMATGAHFKAVCGDRRDRARQLVCQAWLNGASQGNGWFEGRDPALVPSYCPPRVAFDVVRYRDLILGWLDAHPDELKSPAIVVTSKALAAAYPCGKP